MELCYDGALVMPSSYAVMNEEEMSYVEGGEKYGYLQLLRAKKKSSHYKVRGKLKGYNAK